MVALGETVKEISVLLDSNHIFNKSDFSLYSKLINLNKNCILVGIETHICILQTCLDLLSNGYTVYVVVDGNKNN